MSCFARAFEEKLVYTKLNLKIENLKASRFIVLCENMLKAQMSENYRRICFCQWYGLKYDVVGMLDFFHANESPQIKKPTQKYVEQFFEPSVSYEKRVGSVKAILHTTLIFSPNQYLKRARKLLSTTRMPRATKSCVQQRKRIRGKALQERFKALLAEEM